MDYSNIKYAVEANSFETMCLWERYKDKVKWVDEGRGTGVSVKGEVESFVSLTSISINGVDVLVYEPLSQLVDYVAIEKHILVICEPLTTHNMTDAMNFHNIVNEIIKEVSDV